MKIRHLLPFLLLTAVATTIQAQKKPAARPEPYPAQVARPKLIVGLVIDQMRWDYLYRYYARYGSGGFKRLIHEGFSAENTYIPYTPTYTACGHASIYTGTVPAVHGIIGNEWTDAQSLKRVYCAGDTSVSTVGSPASPEGQMSPRNMLSNTITDELRLATNFKGKVIGISMKDRGSILPAGHTANAAYWYDGKSGNWITSTYYMQQLPMWLEDYNKMKLANKFYAKNWEPLYPIKSYVNSTTDEKEYEGRNSTFPHNLTQFANRNYDAIRSTPYGNTITLDLAKLAILSEDLGADQVTDFLAVSCSSTDYIGHQYGPNSIEAEDTYLRLDKDLEEFFNYLDKQVGKGQYLFFITADHGAAHVPGFMAENRLPAGVISDSNVAKELNASLEERFKVKKAVHAAQNNQILFDRKALASAKADYNSVLAASIEFLRTREGVTDAIDLRNIAASTLTDVQKKMITNGYNARRSGDIYYILNPGWFNGSRTGTTHGNWNPYDSHIPLVFMGWHVKPGKTNKNHYMTDIAATLAAMLRIQMPNGNIGEPITELTHQY